MTSLFGILRDVPVWEGVVLFMLLAVLLAYTGSGLPAWTFVIALALYAWGAGASAWAGFLVGFVLFAVPPVRRLLSRGIMRWMISARLLPDISRTEQEALEAGTVWLEGELFSGKPDFDRFIRSDYPGLTADERAFVEGPVQSLCDMTDDWEVFSRRGLPPDVWGHLARHRFFGLVIPTEYGGHGFSASAHSAVVAKAASASPVLGITVMVPNSLGPAELLVHYGTESQKSYWLPRLARHDEIPAFALTEAGAGSDAGAIQARGDVFEGDDGRPMLRLNWNKRYITLAPVATVLGLAFKLRDPKDLLGKGPDPGITCALVRTDLPGVRIGERHDPMGVPFLNGPTEGEDVVVPLEESIIGGVDGVGRGWRMLMECLAAGRGISLPATSTAGVKHAARVASAHAAVRRQFGMPIGSFEGIEEPLARLGGYAYLLEAARRFTCGALDDGLKPAVVTAIMKYQATEHYRKALGDAMDIQGGAAISRGPGNALAHPYMYLPVPVTVEGANILTRTLMIFGQGAIRCHPYLLGEVRALAEQDVRGFDDLFWSHVGHVGRNKVRALFLSLTRGAIGGSPVRGPAARYWRRLSWASAGFAFWADIALIVHGGDLKRREALTGRFADILAWMLLTAAVLRRFEADGHRREDLPFLHWCARHGLSQAQQAFDGLFENMEVPGFGWLVRGPVAAWSRVNRISAPPGDRLSRLVARAILVPGPQRERILGGIHTGSRPLVKLERTMEMCHATDPILGRVAEAARHGLIRRASTVHMIEAAEAAGVISAVEATAVRRAEEAREHAIGVDSFSESEYLKSAVPRPRNGSGASADIRAGTRAAAAKTKRPATSEPTASTEPTASSKPTASPKTASPKTASPKTASRSAKSSGAAGRKRKGGK